MSRACQFRLMPTVNTTGYLIFNEAMKRAGPCGVVEKGLGAVCNIFFKKITWADICNSCKTETTWGTFIDPAYICKRIVVFIYQTAYLWILQDEV